MVKWDRQATPALKAGGHCSLTGVVAKSPLSHTLTRLHGQRSCFEFRTKMGQQGFPLLFLKLQNLTHVTGGSLGSGL